MKVCLIADPHLFSSEIGGDWSEDSFIIFKERFLPKVKEKEPDVVIFLGDILDPHSGRSDPRWPRGDEASGRFVEALKKTGIKNAYALRGNHDYIEPLRNISEMGGLHFIDNDWLALEDENIGFYFFSSRYPDFQKAIADLKSISESIPDIGPRTKILLMHENLSIRGADNLPKDVMRTLSEEFDMIFNGHQHFHHQLYGNVWSLSSALPWRPGSENSDLEIIWEDEKPKIEENENKFGFWVLDTNKKSLNLVPVDLGARIAVARLYFSEAPAALIRERLIKLSDLLNAKTEPERTIIRIYLEGTLKEGEERIDVGFTDVERKYYSHFYEGKSRNVLRVENLKGGGAYLSKEDLRYISVEDALTQLESEISKIKDFYEEVYDLIENKTFDGEALLERIKNSKVLGEINEI